MAPNFRKSRVTSESVLAEGLQTSVTRTSAPLTIQPGLHYTYTMCKEQTRRLNSVSYVPSLTVIAGWNPQ